MAVVLRSMRDFKRFLARPGARIQMVRNTFVERQSAATREAYRAKGLFAPRHVQAVTRKAAIFAISGHPGTVWLYWDKGVRRWRFSGDTVTVPLDTAMGPPDAIVYRCTFAPGFEPPDRRVRVRPPREDGAQAHP